MMVLFSLLSLLSASAWADPVEVTILHTNDLHSHFREERSLQGLGGIARIATAVRTIRKEKPNSLLVDGGDWSEGNIYYTEGTGRESLKMMDTIGYDVALVGNHDWINGPDVLLNSIEHANPKMAVIGTNLSLARYPRGDEFRQHVLPYVIRDVDGVKIAFIGLVTYEFIYDHFVSPVQVTEPFRAAGHLAHELKKQVDAVVLVSHNSVKMNESILRAIPDADLVVGAHDHLVLPKADFVSRGNAPTAAVVEAGCWGQYLGQLTLKVTPRKEQDPTHPAVQVIDYHLNQIDSRYEPDPEILARIDALEKMISETYGDIFNDHVADSEMELRHEELESTIGDVTTDAYRAATGADIAIDQNRFIYGELHPGIIRTVDVFNTIPGVINPKTGKTWTLSVLPMKGRTLLWILNVLYSYGRITQMGSISTSGLELVFNPSLFPDITPPVTTPSRMMELMSNADQNTLSAGYIKEANVDGKPLNPEKTYRVAAGGGIIEAFTFLNSVIPNAVPMEGLVDTGKETWRVLGEYVHKVSRLTPETVRIGGRIRSLQPDLGVKSEDILWKPIREAPGGIIAQLEVRVRNSGATASSTKLNPTVHLLKNANGSDYALPLELDDLTGSQSIPSLAPGESMVFSWNEVFLPLDRGLYNVVVKIEGTGDEFDHANDEFVRFFAPPHTEPAWYNPASDVIK